MARKALGLLLAAGIGVLVASQWQEIVRYVKIEQMSLGNGHPEAVPAKGAQRYPSRPGDGAPDGTGDFDSASRGGPASTEPPPPRGAALS